jgi:hypothetical protein
MQVKLNLLATPRSRGNPGLRGGGRFVACLRSAPMSRDALHAEESARARLRDAVSELDAAEVAAEPARLSQSLAQVSRCHRAVGALSEADWYAKRGLAVARGLGAVDASVDALCELAELSLDRADRLAQDEPRGAHRLRDAARDHAFEATELAQRATDPKWEITVLLRVSDLFDRLGDHDDAIALQCRAIGLICGAVPVAQATA